ncbi:membrane protein [methanotrophic bacterial endosymbiont of Bathymodiolus sp.]|nr:membrane protein [methanotrophic bacterial endosymbiont of Bathymodiolus sp.]
MAESVISKASRSIPFSQRRISILSGLTMIFSIINLMMRDCSSGNNCSQTLSILLSATVTWASSISWYFSCTIDATCCVTGGALRIPLICSTTADSSSAAGILGKPDAPEYSLVSRVLM